MKGGREKWTEGGREGGREGRKEQAGIVQCTDLTDSSAVFQLDLPEDGNGDSIRL